MTPLRITRAGIVGSILVLAVAAGCVRLGFWQLHRLAERRAHNAVVRARLAAAPLALQALPEDTALAFRPATATGRWDSEHAIVLAGQTYDDDPGVTLLTPLLLPGGGAVLVNRGWLPSPDAATIDARAYAVAGAAAVRGLLVPMPTGRVPPAPGFRRVWFHLDPGRLRRQFPYPIAPLLLQVTPGPGDRGLPHPVPPPTLSEGPHLSYAVQWFSFAAIGLIGWVVLLLKNSAGRDEPVAPVRQPG